MQYSYKNNMFYNIINVADGSNTVKITDAIVYYFCKENVPFDKIESESFRNLLETLCPLYKIPSRDTIKRRVDEKYSVLSAQFRDKLSQVQNVTLTTDIWTETMQMRSFIGVTVHFIEGTNIESGNFS